METVCVRTDEQEQQGDLVVDSRLSIPEHDEVQKPLKWNFCYVHSIKFMSFLHYPSMYIFVLIVIGDL